MSLIALVLLVLLTAFPAMAQQPGPSSSVAQQSAAEDTGSASQQAEYDFPVSLERIREGLERWPARPLLQNIDRKPDFRQEIQIQAKIDELLSTTLKDVKPGPQPPQGIYGYEQQQRLWNSVDHPLMQPYAAFSSGELITIAVENLAAKYLGGRAVNAVNDWQRARAQEAARAEVARAIAEYCAAPPPGGGAYARLCDPSSTER
jgi:hypothetical protein